MPRNPKPIDPATPGGQLRELRLRCGLSLGEVAAQYSALKGSGGDPGHLSRIEQGKDVPTKETLDLLLSIYRANPFAQWQLRIRFGYDEPLRLP